MKTQVVHNFEIPVPDHDILVRVPAHMQPEPYELNLKTHTCTCSYYKDKSKVFRPGDVRLTCRHQAEVLEKMGQLRCRNIAEVMISGALHGPGNYFMPYHEEAFIDWYELIIQDGQIFILNDGLDQMGRFWVSVYAPTEDGKHYVRYAYCITNRWEKWAYRAFPQCSKEISSRILALEHHRMPKYGAGDKWGYVESGLFQNKKPNRTYPGIASFPIHVARPMDSPNGPSPNGVVKRLLAIFFKPESGIT